MQEHLDANLSSALAGMVIDCREGEFDRKNEMKIWIIARKDVELSKGKFGAQTGHAAGTCMVLTERSNSGNTDLYLSLGQPKITVGVENEEELVKCFRLCREAMLVAVLVQDAGRTELDGKTYTVAAVGPCLRSELPGPVKRLRTLRESDEDVAP